MIGILRMSATPMLAVACAVLVIVGAALFLGGVGDVLPVGMAILAGLSLMTAAHRILLVYRAAR